MKKNFKKILCLTFTLVLALGTLAGCGAQTKKDSKKETVKLVSGNWSEGIAMTNLAAAVLEEKMDYDVKTTFGELGIVFTSLAQGDSDAFVDAWLPKTTADYIEKYKDDLVDLGKVFENARIGLVVPDYVDINSIEELNANKDKFKGEIIGIDAGAGIMKATNNALKDYNLNLKLIEGSGPAMTTMLKNAIDKKEPIVVTGWKPHWMFSRFKLKFLDDPKKTYGEVENLHVLSRKGLDKDMPEVTQFLKNFKLNDQQLGGLMGDIAESNKKPLEVAKEWMAKNEDLVNSWIPKK